MTASRREVFCDRSLGGKVVPDALRAIVGAEITVIAHDERFAQDTDDAVWLREAGRNGWIVLTKDEKIRRRPGQQRAIVEAGVRCFCLHPSKGLTGPAMAAILLRALPKLLRIADQEAAAFVKTIDRGGTIRHLFPPRDVTPATGSRSDRAHRHTSHPRLFCLHEDHEASP